MRKWLMTGTLLMAALLVPLLGLSNYWLFYLCVVGITAILTSSLNLAMGYTGLVSMVHTGLYASGAYVSAILVTHFGLSFWIGLPVAVVVSALLGALISLATLRASHLYFAMITMAFNLILVEIFQEWTGVTGGQVGLFGVPRPHWLGKTMGTTGYYYLVLVAVVLTLLATRQLVSSRFGRAFMALKLKEEAASALGVNPLVYKTLSFSISAAMAGLAGVLFAHLGGFVSPSLAGGEGGLNLFVALLMGGAGTMVGPLLGVAFVSVVQKLIAPWALYQQFIFGAILLVTMFVLPKGLLGTLQAVWQRRRRQPAPEGPAPGSGELSPELLQLLAPVTRKTVGPAIRVSGIAKRFGGVQALGGVDLTVASGTVHGLVGPNGSGKSTLVGVITGYHKPDSGQIAFDGTPVHLPPHLITRLGVVRVFQVPHLFGDMSLLENVLAGFHQRARQGLVATLLGLPGFRREEAAMRANALTLLRFAGLAHLADTPAGKLPHGQQRLLEVVRALAVGPHILILDEPCTGLTTLEIAHLDALIRRLQGAGVTILLIEHNMPFVMGICSRISVLENGQMLAEGTPDEVQRNPQVIAAYLGNRGEKGEVSLHA